MALQLIPPGKRGNKTFIARGRINGHLYEYSLQTEDRAAARRRMREFEDKIKADGPLAAGTVTFADAATRYRDFRQPREVDVARIEALVGVLGRRRLRDLNVSDIHEAATRLKPGTSGATKNREVVRVAAAIWHYAAKAGLCSHVAVTLFPEETPRTQALDQEDAGTLIAATDPGTPRRLLLLWLFHQGMRISHTLAVPWDKIDLDRGTVEHREQKGRRPHDYVFPLHAEVIEELRRVPAEERAGPVFPWRNRSSVYDWLKPLSERLGIPFTPHMARHSRGTWLNDAGAGLRTIMEALGHASERSSLRYQHGNVEIVRAAGSGISLRKERA